jgi:integrase
MTRSPNLIRRGGTYHFRRAVPCALRSAFGAHEYVRSLRTSDEKLASVKSRSLYVALENCFERLRSDPMLSPEEISDIVADFRSISLEIENLTRQAEPLSEAQRQLLVGVRQEDIADAQLDAARGDTARANLALATMVQRRKLALNEFERRQLGHALLVAGIDIMGVSLARLGGDFSDLLKGSVSTAASSPVQQLAPAQSSAPAEVALQSSAMPLLSVASADFLRHQRAGKIWDEQTLRQAKKTFELTIEIVGDRPLDRYGRQEANKVKSVLQDLPADYGKAALFRGVAAPDILAIDKQRNPTFERLSPRTVKRHLSVLSAFWKWEAREGVQLTNVFQGFSFPSAKRANEQREMWNTEDLRTLFASPVWMGSKSASRRTEAGTHIIRDEKFWLPLIALFSGMRQEEICQLQVEDVRRVDNFWVFDLNPRPPRKLKNKNAIRMVPVHPDLISIGFFEFVGAQKHSGHTALFPGLEPGGADERLGHSFSKWFARYRQAIGIYRRGLDFHSLRHTATTLLYRADVPAALIDELTGHATPGETARYSHGSTMKQRADAISQIQPQLDFLHLRRS